MRPRSESQPSTASTATCAACLVGATLAGILCFSFALSANAGAAPSTTVAPTTVKAAAPTTAYTATTVYTATTSYTATTAKQTSTTAVATTTPKVASTVAPTTAKPAPASAPTTARGANPSTTLDPGTEPLPAEAKDKAPRLLVDGGPDATADQGDKLLSPILKLRLLAAGAGALGMAMLVLTIRYARRTRPYVYVYDDEEPSDVTLVADRSYLERATARTAAPATTSRRPAPAAAPRPAPRATPAPAPVATRAASPEPWTPRPPRWGENRQRIRPPGSLPPAASGPRPVFASTLTGEHRRVRGDDRTGEHRIPTGV